MAEKPKAIILDLCGGTGAWSDPYRRRGYDVHLITLPENDVRDYIPPSGVHGVLAAPPCTMFSLARSRAKIERDIVGALAVVDACIRIAVVSRPVWWVLENPMGLLRRYLGGPRITVQPYWFGDSHSKMTDLWGDFTVPRFSPVRLSADEIHAMKQNTRKLQDLGLSKSDARAVTPKNFARAFFEANP